MEYIVGDQFLFLKFATSSDFLSLDFLISNSSSSVVRYAVPPRVTVNEMFAMVCGDVVANSPPCDVVNVSWNSKSPALFFVEGEVMFGNLQPSALTVRHWLSYSTWPVILLTELPLVVSRNQ